jgi:two-component system, chemotaxis family, chemotaxis protein CheY
MPRVALEIGAAADSFPLTAVAGRIMALVAPAPVMQPRAVAAAPASNGPDRFQDIRTKALADIRVMVVDDQASMRGLARLSLNELGFQKVTEARSGEDALAQTEAEPTDLILLDWNMDGLSGLDVLKTMRQKRNDKSTVVVMTTSEKNITKVHEATQAGANNYLVKPYNVPQLKARLERALMRHL